MLQKLKALFTRKPDTSFVPPIPEFTDIQNVLLIQAFPRKRTVSVTYKGVTKVGYFQDNVIKKMLDGRHFEQNTENFVRAVAQLIKQLTQ